MAPPRPSESAAQWQPSGFPPRSFPPGGAVVHSARTGPDRPPGQGRGRWLAAAAALLAVILLVGGILVASRDDGGGSKLASGTSTSAADTSVPGLEESTTTGLAATPGSVATATTGAPGVGTTAAITPVPATGAPAGVLEISTAMLVLPQTDANVGASQGTLALRNTGAGALMFTVQPSVAALTAAPVRGSIGPGVSVILTVTLDGGRISNEGPFLGTLTLGGTGGFKSVEVQSVVGRPPEFTDNVGEVCPPRAASCSQQIKLAPTSDPSPTPCNTPWLYSITIVDQSRIPGARSIARVGIANADASLQRGGNSDIFQSTAFAPLPLGTVLRFAIEAADQFGFARRLPEQSVSC